MTSKATVKVQLSAMNFLEFAVWGAYLVCMGQYLGSAGMGDLIPWFYAIQGIVSIFMPAIMGIIADKFVQPQLLLGFCHAMAGLFMGLCWWLGMQSAKPDPGMFITFYTVSVAFFMPTIALSNTVAFRILNAAKMDTIRDFPPIRVFGTVGFIAMMWFVNFAYVSDDGQFGFSADSPFRFQYTQWQFFASAFMSIILAVYCMTLPKCPIIKTVGQKQSFAETLGLNAFKLFKKRTLAMFFIFSMLLGMCLQVTNGYATPYIQHFLSIESMKDLFFAQNSTLLTSLSQISEAVCILLIPVFLRKFGIKIVMLISMVAWVLRFGFLGLGNPGDGVWLFILSMLVYGVAFDFFNVSGALFIERETDKSIQASAQGLFMLMTNGLGATIGTLSAGAIVNSLCHWTDQGYLVGNGNDEGNWTLTWMIFAAFAAVVAVAFFFLFKYKHNPNTGTGNADADSTPLDAPEGFVYDGVDEVRNAQRR